MVQPLSLKENWSYRFEQMKYSYFALSSNTRARKPTVRWQVLKYLTESQNKSSPQLPHQNDCVL